MDVDLDIRALARAVALLDAAMIRQAQAPDDDMLRDACIQRFEFVYELSHKTLRRFLRAAAANPDVIDALNFPDLIREGSAAGLLLNGWPRWRDYRDARAISSHTYDEEKARRVFAVIPPFQEEARCLLARLQAELSP
jgi:nucleotidyltransferase substrate binding protein (TIGR01987 family)